MAATSPLELAITLQGDLDAPATTALARRADDAGLSHLWLFDSALQGRDPYPLITLAAGATTRLRFGTCVTNPATRHPAVTASLLATIAELSRGRVDLGIGRGDSAVRMVGEEPPPLADLERAVHEIRDLVEGRPVRYAGVAQRLVYAVPHPLPVWVAGYGPRVLALAGRMADGVVIQLADPPLVAWLVGHVRAGAVAAGRDPDEIRVQVAAPGIIGDPGRVRELLRWFPALVANHVLDLLRRAAPGTLPPALVDYVDRGAVYDYVPQHTGDYSFVDDDTIDRFCLVGDAATQSRRIEALRDAGMTQLNVYPLPGREAETIDAYASLVRTVGVRA
jgi:probable F420-dependent oxidoreductase